QCCSTVQYILGEQKPVLSNADTRIESPYNTYIIDGLPKGPICSPGKASIDAVFEPADTDHLYFVLKSKDSTSHNFSKSYEEFIKDKNKYAESFK
ncbi:MAG: endolytic transglycosylase MltG, partial [Eubacteriales bacterium]|nr:endolytic transglycosylase MltG [Eubacteriales bacterium]